MAEYTPTEQKDFRDLTVGKTDIKALEGKITATGVFIASDIIAEKTLKDACESVVEAIDASSLFQNSPTVFFYNPADYQQIPWYHAILEQVSELDTQFSKAINHTDSVLSKARGLSPIGGAMPFAHALGYAVSAGLRTVIDIASLFRTNTTFTNADLTVDETSLVASFSEALIKKSWKVFHPGIVPVDLINKTVGNFIVSWNALKLSNENLKKNVQQIVDEIISCQNSLLSTPPPDDIVKSAIGKRIELLNRIKSEVSSLSAAFTQFENHLITADAATSLPALSLVNRTERLVAKMSQPNCFIVKLSAKSRGSDKITENMFRSAKITHSGGTALSCLLFSTDGSLVFAHNDRQYVPFKPSEEITADFLSK